MKKVIVIALTVTSMFFLSKFSLPAFAQLTIWGNSGDDKVTRDELRATTDSTAVINSTWDGNKIAIFGAKNEVVTFNLILESPTTAASNVTVAFNTLSGPGGSSITSTAATGNGVFNWVNRNIELFYVRYLEIKGVSTDIFFHGFNYDERHIPERLRRPWTGEGDGTGTWTDRPDHNKFYPDIAVPLELVNQFNITAAQNQSIWADVYIPKTVPAGLFTGTVVISENGAQIAEVPVELTVKNFTLPDLPTARTMLYYSNENINERYLGNSYIEEDTPEYKQSLALIDTHFQLAHRHRISLIDNYIEINRMDDAWTSRLTGSLFTSEKGYAGPGVGVGNNIYSIGTYSSWPWFEGIQADMWTNTDAWVDYFDSQAFTTPTDYFLYLIDEALDFGPTEQWAQWMDSNPGSGSRLKSMATLSLPDAVASTPSLDIPTSWVPFGIPESYQSAADSLKADLSKQLYLYNGGRPGCGTFAIEDEGVSPRVIAWTHYKMKADRWFYWESTYYNNYQAGEGKTNVFQRAQCYGSFDRVDESLGETGWNYLNGDGVLFYPGTDTQYPSDSYGVNGPFASLRLKYWRRGLQDYEYLIQAAAIDPTQTTQIINKIIPKVAWEVRAADETETWAEADISWSTNSEVWEKARSDLADIIADVKLTGRCKITGLEITGTPSESNPVKIKVNAQSGSETINYRYSMHGGYGTSSYDGSHWFGMTSSEYQTENSCDYTFDTSEKSIVVVWATSSGTDSVDPNGVPIIGWSVDNSDAECKTHFTGVTVTGEQKVNEKITFAVSAENSCGNSNYYRFSMHPYYGTDDYDGTHWQSMTSSEWISSNSAEYTFTEAGKYIVVVWVSDDTNSVDPKGVPIIGWSVDID